MSLQLTDYYLLASSSLPFVKAPKYYKGCMGRIVKGVPFIQGAYAQNPELVFSWLLHRYPIKNQEDILVEFAKSGDEDYLLSIPDILVDGLTPQQFGQLITKVRRAGFRPNVFLTSKAGPNDLQGLINQTKPFISILKQTGVPRASVGWELNDWLSPEVLRDFTDWLVTQLNWGIYLYVHFTEGIPHWAIYPGIFADYWNYNVNKLRGLLHQKVMTQNDITYQIGENGLRDVLLHFNGGSLCTADSGDGTPFDLIAFEVDLELFSEATITENEMHRRAVVGINTPVTNGPTGIVKVMGSGCGLTT